jgi:hypothetical protein
MEAMGIEPTNHLRGIQKLPSHYVSARVTDSGVARTFVSRRITTSQVVSRRLTDALLSAADRLPKRVSTQARASKPKLELA